MKNIGAALGDDIDYATHGPPKFRAVTAVDHAEFTHRFLRGSVFLHTRGGGNIIRAIHGDEVVMDILAGKRQLGHGFDNHIRAARGGIANLYPRS